MVAREFQREKMPVPLALRLRRLGRWGFALPVLVLIPCFLGYLMRQGTGADRFYGLVEAESETVGAVGTVRILSIEVQPGQRVEPGAVLVRLDPAGPVLDRAVQETRLIDAEQSARRDRQTLQESERRCRQIVQEAAVALETERMNQARDEAERTGLESEIARLQPLVEKRLVSEMELSALRPKAMALEKTLTRYAPLLEVLQARHAQAQVDLAEVQRLLADLDDSGTNRTAVTLESIGQEGTEPAVLRATRAGVVSRIQCQAGDVVVAGQAIVRVTAEHSRYITGLLPQRQLASVALGDRLQVRRTADVSAPALEAQVTAIEPEVLDLLDPFNPAPRFPARGRRVRMQMLDAASALVPGESVILERPGRGWAEWFGRSGQ